MWEEANLPLVKLYPGRRLICGRGAIWALSTAVAEYPLAAPRQRTITLTHPNILVAAYSS
ncbi:hypothetical protein ACE41H_21345 [Paenibacillus enshidis]|uniref:Uncharacterized protein n=1 Tax=Paenibacillus enshidis TaxID=1458439 RepID=A0ABV5AYL1_9BACL